MKIRAAVIERRGGPFELVDLDLAGPQPHEVLVRVEASGVCRTDLHVRDQEYPIPLPVVAGHEGAGVVEAVGSQVTDFVEGDRVVMSYPRCGACRTCLTADYSYCEHGFALSFGGSRLDGSSALRRGGPDGELVHGHIFQQSSFASHAVVPTTNLVRAPDDLPLDLLAPLGCGLQTGAGAVMNSLGVSPGSSFLVTGTGGVGLAAVMAAAASGASTIVAVDTVEARRSLALELGATHAIDPLAGSFVEEVVDLTHGGAAYALETTGVPEVLRDGVAALAMTGTLAMVGAAPAGTAAPIDMNTLMNGRRIRGVIQGDAVPQLFLPQLIDLHRSGRFPMERLVAHYDFDDIQSAVDDMASGAAIKPVLRMTH